MERGISMKLQTYDETLEEKMSEFDIWVTPSLGEIRDMPQFKVNLDSMKSGFDYMAQVTRNFESVSSCSSSALAKNTVQLIADEPDDTKQIILNCLCGVLLLVTGKTDNNLKCQFPLLLRNTYGMKEYPQKNSAGRWINKQLPRTLQFDAVSKIIIQADGKADFQEKFLESYFHLIISDETYAKQLWSLGTAYYSQKQIGNAEALLSPIVVFQSRGSITATQGHIPETILRSYMAEWGLEAGTDYNTQDVEIGQLLGDIVANPQIKKRKYDFIIPYQSRESGAKVFVQSQFYAGDSGSVSHKVVDQTDSSREVTLKKYPQAVFVEYLDGAGYFSSLNGDLRKMLAKPSTKDFIQIATAPLKLRRELQGINFLTTLEIEHAILMTGGKKVDVIEKLLKDGYSVDEIDTALKAAIRNAVLPDNEFLTISHDRESIVRKYCILDTIANYGQPIPADSIAGYLTVPGYSTYWGLLQADVIKRALEIAPMLNSLWRSHIEPFDDIQWLLEKGFVKTK